ncbi:hypothetical protein [Leifsonia sp. ALI-44-B]|uniref:hypothetical protein n=1 Tax=Leifsonia sp. ALI-44-B TaxID=1933776 RepID=UPI00117A2FDE|nr:hypothetical protein [Leifsonia sp. ALI-44-B]
MADTNSTSAQLSITERVLAAVTAAILLSAGVIAVFLTENEIGVAALFLIGAALAMLALTGQTLRRIKIGENETEFYAKVGRNAVATAESETATPTERETAREIVERASDSAADLPSRVVDITLARTYERTTFAALKRVSDDVTFSEMRGLDAIVNKKIGIDVKYRSAGRPPGRSALSKGGNYRPAIEAASNSGIKALLILTNSTVDDDSPVVIDDTLSGQVITVRIMQWTADSPDLQLAEAIQELDG